MTVEEIDKKILDLYGHVNYEILYISYKQLSEIDNILVQRLSLTEEQE